VIYYVQPIRRDRSESTSGQGTFRWSVLNSRLALQSETFWGSRLRGADIDFLSLDLQLRDSQEAFDSFELKTRHVDREAEGREAAGAFSP
jgi:hypothetical protein